MLLQVGNRAANLLVFGIMFGMMFGMTGHHSLVNQDGLQTFYISVASMCCKAHRCLVAVDSSS